ncbi:hypothetical protein [Prosthecobacter vanneervenii]|uniref:Uncharacterized protein n=1 Tax=Prosthecobacter vanneervenii TaxID=48466 RepID=A0A7W7Y8S1_9BACT|nr:hypothetical protein [Prosthecobacter vanneervenii]MBB5031733.1 hypothetical protein [Prosthecobacter vanneervenii]
MVVPSGEVHEVLPDTALAANSSIVSTRPPAAVKSRNPSAVLLAVILSIGLVAIVRLGGNHPETGTRLEDEKVLSACRLEWDLNSGWPTSAQLQTVHARPPLTSSQLQVVEAAFRKARSALSHKDHPLSGPRTLWRFTTSDREYHVSFEPLRSRDGHSGPWVSIHATSANASWFDGGSEHEVEGDDALPLIDLLDHLAF